MTLYTKIWYYEYKNLNSFLRLQRVYRSKLLLVKVYFRAIQSIYIKKKLNPNNDTKNRSLKRMRNLRK